jgi:TonB-linked SusC/RagA family outer membrane protein
MSPSPRRMRAAFWVGAAVGFTCAALPAAAQQRGTIRGVVTDATTLSPIVGAHLAVVGTRVATLTDREGSYTLANVPIGGVQVRARMLGYTSVLLAVTVGVDEPAVVDLTLSPSVILLDEIVVTGAGGETQRKQLGNTIAKIDAKTIENAPVQTFSEAIAAREPGVQILPSTGLAGEGARIRIRGNASLSQNNEPVVYVDGVRIDNGGGFTYADAGGAGTPSRLDDINPEVIDRVEILKGAAAATLYGSEANAGVIQIFTKKGSAGRPRFSFRVEQAITNYPRSANKALAGFARYATDAECIAAETPTRGTGAPTACRTVIGVAERLSAIFGETVTPYQVFEKDFINELFGTGYGATYSGSVTGGGETAVYHVAARFASENGPIDVARLDPLAGTRDLNRKAQGSASLSLFPRERFQLRVGALYTDVHHETPNNANNIYGVVSSAINSKPEQADCERSRLRGLGGSWGQDPSRRSRCAGPGDPWGSGAFITTREAAYQETTQDAEHFYSNVGVGYLASPSVKLDLTVGMDVTNANDAELLPFGYNVDVYTTNRVLGQKTVGTRNHRNFTVDGKAAWTAKVNQFSSNLIVGTQGFVTRTRIKGLQGWDFPGRGLEVAEAGAQRNITESFNSVVNLGALAQEQISYDDWAFLTLGARWDRNSAFGESSPWAFYPKVNFSVVPSDLPTWNVPVVSTLRVRGAIGKSGLQPGAFDKLPTFVAIGSEIGPAFVPGNLGNSDLKPEVSTEYEAGAEIGVLNNRAGLDLTYWRRDTRDALVPRQFPATGGYIATQLVNIGSLQSSGWDLKLNALVLDRPDVSISVFANGAFLSQTIRSMGSAPVIKAGGSYPRYRNFLHGPDTLYSAPGVIDEIRYYAPGALLGAQIIPACAGNPTYRGGPNAGTLRPCYRPGATVPYDTNGDGQPDTEAELLAYLAVPRSPDALGLNPMFDDEDGDLDRLDHYYGKPMPDWQGAFGANVTIRRNLQVNLLFEYKAGNYTVTNLTDAFRKANPVIGRNIRGVAEVEATLLNPASTPEQRAAAAMDWALKYKALSPYDGMNQNEYGDFIRWREVGVTYNAPASFAARFGVENLAFSITGRNLALWTGYTGIDPEQNSIGRGGSVTLRDNNYLDAVDGWGVPLPRRFTFSVRFGL